MTTEKKKLVGNYAVGGGAVIIALISLFNKTLGDSNSALNDNLTGQISKVSEVVSSNARSISINRDDIETLKTQAAVNREQHKQILEKLDELTELIKEY